jgi:RNA polymerase sigma-70 factor, ECF subfamily
MRAGKQDHTGPCFTTMTDADLSDEALVQRACDGEEAAFEVLLRRHAGAVRRLAARYFRNRSMIDDMAQETFAKAYFSLRSFRNDSPFIYWLKKIAVRVCLDEMRKRKIRGRDLEEDLESAAESVLPETMEPRIEARLLLHRMLRDLNPLDRMILVLLYAEECNTAEIAGLTGLSQPNIKVRAFRIRRRLKTLFAGDPA